MFFLSKVSIPGSCPCSFVQVEIFCVNTTSSQKVPESRKTLKLIFHDCQALRSIVCLAISFHTWPNDPDKANFQLETRPVKVIVSRTEKKVKGSQLWNASLRGSSQCDERIEQCNEQDEEEN